MAKTAEKLAKELELGEYPVNYYDYIVESFVNGQKTQCVNLFKRMIKSDRITFLTNYLDEKDYYHNETRDLIIRQTLN